jgi:hypothetical protein
LANSGCWFYPLIAELVVWNFLEKQRREEAAGVDLSTAPLAVMEPGHELGHYFLQSEGAHGETHMLGTILLIILILLLIGALPRWGYSGSWGYGPSGLLGVVLIVVLILVLTGRL